MYVYIYIYIHIICMCVCVCVCIHIYIYFFNNLFFFENHAVYEIAWKNIVQPVRSQMTTIWRMRVTCWITKATNTHSEFVILIVFFQQQQWLHERASMLCYTYIALYIPKLRISHFTHVFNCRYIGHY